MDFEKNYNTTDNTFTLNQLLEHAREFNLLLCLLFINYGNASDSVDLNVILRAPVKRIVEN